MNVNTKLAKTIFKTRVKKHLTQVQLATKSGLGRRTIQRLESADVAEYNPKLSTLVKVASALKKQMSALI